MGPVQEAAEAQLPILLPHQQHGEWRWTHANASRAMPPLASGIDGVATPEALSLLSRLQAEVHHLRRQQQLQQEQQQQWQWQQQLIRHQSEATTWLRGKPPDGYQHGEDLCSSAAIQQNRRQGELRRNCN